MHQRSREFMFFVASRSIDTATAGPGRQRAIMSQKRSYLESLNAGRQRRPSTSIERLNRTLEELEGRMAAPADQQHRPVRPSSSQEQRAPTRPYSDLARTVRQARSREEEFALREPDRHRSADLREEVSQPRWAAAWDRRSPRSDAISNATGASAHRQPGDCAGR